MTKEQKILFDEGKLLPIMEDFYSIQGEGFNTGTPAYFIRLGGCDTGCFWCDVKESWDASLHPLTLVDDVVGKASATPAKAIVVTGGEPALYNLDYLCSCLKAKGIKTFLETSGVKALTGQWDWICLSPKQGTNAHPEYFQRADELKVIIHKEKDLEWAEQNAERVQALCKLNLQPEWSNIASMLPVIIEYVKKHPKWRVSLQSHKYMNIP